MNSECEWASERTQLTGTAAVTETVEHTYIHTLTQTRREFSGEELAVTRPQQSSSNVLRATATYTALSCVVYACAAFSSSCMRMLY